MSCSEKPTLEKPALEGLWVGISDGADKPLIYIDSDSILSIGTTRIPRKHIYRIEGETLVINEVPLDSLCRVHHPDQLTARFRLTTDSLFLEYSSGRRETFERSKHTSYQDHYLSTKDLRISLPDAKYALPAYNLSRLRNAEIFMGWSGNKVAFNINNQMVNAEDLDQKINEYFNSFTISPPFKVFVYIDKSITLGDIEYLYNVLRENEVHLVYVVTKVDNQIKDLYPSHPFIISPQRIKIIEVEE